MSFDKVRTGQAAAALRATEMPLDSPSDAGQLWHRASKPSHAYGPGTNKHPVALGTGSHDELLVMLQHPQAICDELLIVQAHDAAASLSPCQCIISG